MWRASRRLSPASLGDQSFWRLGEWLCFLGRLCLAQALVEHLGPRRVCSRRVSLLAREIFKAKKPNGARAAAKEMAKERYGWGRYQFGCLDTLWTKESNWNFRARNPRTGAYGIPQALPASKMAIRGDDWRTNPLTQISWGMHYVDVRYETPCKALRKFQRSRYY